MTDEQIALARRAVACKGFRWMAGMRAVGKFPNYPVRIHAFGENVQDPDDMLAADKWLPWQQPVEYGDHTYDGPYLPDLTDAATLGCLLALVQEAWRCAVITSPDCAVKTVRWVTVREGDTEAALLVAALEAAP